MKTLTHSELKETLAKILGTAIVGLLTYSDAKAKKTGNKFGTIFKRVRSVGFTGADYGAAVNREMERQTVLTVATFEPSTLPWGQWEIQNKVISHNGKLYLRTESTPGNRRVQPARVLSYHTADGKYISKEEIRAFLPESKESSRQQSFGLNKTVWVRTWAFDSIKKIRINGETFELIS